MIGPGPVASLVQAILFTLGETKFYNSTLSSPKRDDERPRHFHMGAPPPASANLGAKTQNQTKPYKISLSTGAPSPYENNVPFPIFFLREGSRCLLQASTP